MSINRKWIKCVLFIQWNTNLEQTTDTHNNMDECLKHYPEQKKPDTKQKYYFHEGQEQKNPNYGDTVVVEIRVVVGDRQGEWEQGDGSRGCVCVCVCVCVRACVLLTKKVQEGTFWVDLSTVYLDWAFGSSGV